MMELGISSWTVPWSIGVAGYPSPQRPLDPVGLLELAVRAGVTRVQIADNLPLDQLSDDELSDLGSEARERGLTLEAGTRGVEREHLKRYIAIAHRIGAPILRTVLSGRLLDREALAKTESHILEAVPMLEANDVRLALENNEAFGASEYASLMTRLSHPLLGICLDTANSLGRPEVLESVVQHLAGHAVMLHAKDYDIVRVDTRMGFSVVGQPAGAGRVDFPWLLGELRKFGRNQMSVIVEHWPPFQGEIEATVRMEEEWLVTSVNYLRDAIQSAG